MPEDAPVMRTAFPQTGIGRLMKDIQKSLEKNIAEGSMSNGGTDSATSQPHLHHVFTSEHIPIVTVIIFFVFYVLWKCNCNGGIIGNGIVKGEK
jgi:hypothetical protein